MTTTRGSSSNVETHSTTHGKPRTCLRCGASLSSANRSITCYCHERTYDPRIDGEWTAKLTAYVSENIGSTIHPTARFGIAEGIHVVSRSICKLRRQGWVIHSKTGQDCYLVQQAPPVCDIVSGDNGETPTEGGEIP